MREITCPFERPPDPRGRRGRCWRGLIPLGILSVLLLTLAVPALGQATGTVRGRVVHNLRPLAGAQVFIPGTGRGTLTNASGEYLLLNVPAGQHTVRAELIGYTAGTRTLTVGAGETAVANFELTEAAIALDEVVVTGTVGNTQRRAVGNAVSTVNADQVVEVAPVNNLQQLINGRAAGVVIQPATGQVGSGSRIRVRGASSLSLSNEPLIYVDGVRVSNAFESGPRSQGFGSATISRFNDFNPEDIESIEIIKGPAAATLYGTEAAAGVIQIITKKGVSGTPRWNVTVKQGVNYLQNPEGRFWTNYQIVPEAQLQDALAAGGQLVDEQRGIVSLDIVELEDARGHSIFETGNHQEYDLNVRGGGDIFRYFAGGSFEDSQGAEPINTLDRWSTRLNLSVDPSERFGVNLNLAFINSDTRVPAEAGFGGRVWSTVLADPRNLTNPLRRGFHTGTPEGYDALYHFTQGVSRFTGSLQLNHQPMSWFRHRLTIGSDQTREDNVIFFPRIDSLVANPVFGSEALGRKDAERIGRRVNTVDYSASAIFDLASTLRSTTSVGGQYYTTSRDSLFAQGFVFPAPGLSSVSATTSERVNAEGFIEDRTLGFFVQEQLAWRDRFFLTAALRADDNSAFGENFDRVYYPKFSASWVVGEEPFWTLGFVNTLRLRAAYGESGKQPQTFAALRTYEPVTGPGGVAAVTPQLIGNPDLGPEKGREIELGFDAGFLNDRLGLEFTYYNQTTEDAILEREIAPSIGFSGRQFFNAGEVRNSGVELLTRARPVERQNVAWDLTVSLATNSSEVVDLGPGVEFVSAGSLVRHQVGRPIGAYYEQRVVSAELNETGQAINVMCDNGQGGSVLCTGPDGRFGTADDAPDIFLGRSLPDVEGSVSSTLTLLQNFRLYALVDFKRGNLKMDGNTRVRCTFFGGRCRENFFPQEFDPKRIAAIQSNNNLVDFLLDDASFAKLREVSLSYILPERFASYVGAGSASLSIAGRNLYTWTDYGGLEPEAMFLGGTRGGNFGSWEQTTLPQLTQWIASINVSF